MSDAQVWTALDDSILVPEERRLVVFGTLSSTWAAELKADDRGGRCYELALAWVAHHLEALDAKALRTLNIKLVHGSIQGFDFPRIGHAWVEYSDPDSGKRRVQEVGWQMNLAVGRWNRYANPTRSRQYSPRQAVDRVLDSDHSGPWHSRPFGIEDCPHGGTPGRCEHGCSPSTLMEDGK